MNKNELSRILRQENIRPDAYCLEGGICEECYALDESYGIWSVYYSERGVQTGRKDFTSESDACEHLLQLLREDPTARSAPERFPHAQ
jgi:hypothetical protein